MKTPFKHKVLSLPRSAKRGLAIAVDATLCVLTVLFAFYLRLGEWIPFSGHSDWSPIWAATASIAIALPIFISQGFYRVIFRYSGWPVLSIVAKSMFVYGLLYCGVFTAIGIPGVPRTIGIIQPMLLLICIGLSRVFVKDWLGGVNSNKFAIAALPRVVVYGAGSAGRQLVTALANSHEMRVVGFLDDDDRLHGHVLNGQPIYNPADLTSLVPTLNISNVFLAMPSLSRKRRNEILAHIAAARVAVRTLPSMSGLIHGKVSVSHLRELDVDDLLGREAVTPNHILLAMNVRDRVVMVTGAGGSIGSELCRQIVAIGPRKLLLIDQSEFALYEVHRELEERLVNKETVLVPLLASVQDQDRMHQIMSTWCPDTVYHAAAYKHVPLVEHNLVEGIKNNVFGTLRTAKAAIDNNVTNFVLVSTDKAVRPTNIMGASKRVAELVLQALAYQSRTPEFGFAGGPDDGTRFSMVRFGNVLGSSGSVVPKFRQQIRDGGPITLTHPDVTRYFMTIPEAAQLVIQAGAMAKGGDVFVLDMGNPVRIIDLARRMIELAGLSEKNEQNPSGDIEIEITGLRPGEKLYEELLIGDAAKPTPHPRVMKAHEEYIPWGVLETELSYLQKALDNNDVKIVLLIIERLVTGCALSAEIVDWVFLEKGAELLSSSSG
jgi:FlaA1/EpsC-like NDP-sugar epimerase